MPGHFLNRLFGQCLLIAGLLAITHGMSSADEPYRHWAFQPLAGSRSVPSINSEYARDPIDAFIVQSLMNNGLALAPQADARSLIRRVSFDLTGLPPSPIMIQEFLQDQSPQAYEALLDRLLSSPHFGERWGRHWLDNAGYVDVQGLDNDAGIISTTENKWLYRDYVIQSFNEDKPFDQFLLEQLAGDECIDWRNADQYTDETKRMLIATGFLRTAADDTSANELNRRDVHHQILERTHEVVINNLLGLTLQCAKCHDHKYEPLLQADYYRWQAFFQPAFNPDRWLQPATRQIPNVSAAETQKIEQHNRLLDEQIARLTGQIADVRKPFEKQVLDQKLQSLPESIRADTLTAVQTAAEQRTEIQKYLASKLEGLIKVKPEEVTARLTEAASEAINEFQRQISTCSSQKQTYQHWQAVYDAGPATPTHILVRGNPLTPGDEISPEMLSVLLPPGASSTAIIPQFGSSGRRLALARRLTDPDSAAGSLAIRVRVNRIWQQLFGRGLVKTTDNLGVTGANPTHPELLEWLCRAFLDDGQRLKPFLKRVMMSSTYRQSSVRNDEPSQRIDPDNTLLWKQRIRRLESESVRDALLTVAGNLDSTMGGPPIPVEPRPDGSFVIKKEGLPSPTAPYRRSIYLLGRRNYHPTLLSVFDQPNLTTNCAERSTSAVVLQSLTMLNDTFVLDQAAVLSSRIRSSTPEKERWLANLFEVTLGRMPRESESNWCQAAMISEIEFHQQTDPQLTTVDAEERSFTRVCHVLLNTSEFLMVP